MMKLEPEFYLNKGKIQKSVCKWSQKNAKEEKIINMTAKIEECDMVKKTLKNLKSKINPCYGRGQIYCFKECPFGRKECFNWGQKDYKHLHCRKPKNEKMSKMKNTVSLTKMENTEIKNVKKLVKVQMNNKKINFQLDTSSDVTLMNEKICKKIGRPTQLETEKIALGITRNKLKFEGECDTNVIFMGKTIRLKGFVMNWTQNLFRIDWTEAFNILNQPINSFCYFVIVNSNSVEKLKKN